MSKLEGKIAVITGGNSGIGLAAAKKFVDEGAYVFITGRRQSELDRAKAEIGRNVTTVCGDVAKLEDLDQLYAQVRDEKGVIDIVVVSAGVTVTAPIEAVTPELYDKNFGVNARGAFFTVQKALPLMTRGGAIVLVGSGKHMKGSLNYGPYAGSKAALRSFARTWANELKDRGIRVNCLSPGAVDTPIVYGHLNEEEIIALKARVAQTYPLGRLGQAEELASAVLFLASDESSFTTGIDLVVDGGASQV
jgi:NAD(P)-dependent dehydrogenase (short-subunit alcohol dehydrogenase family)